MTLRDADGLAATTLVRGMHPIFVVMAQKENRQTDACHDAAAIARCEDEGGVPASFKCRFVAVEGDGAVEASTQLKRRSCPALGLEDLPSLLALQIAAAGRLAPFSRRKHIRASTSQAFIC